MSDKLTTTSSKTGDETHSPVNDRRNFIKKGALAAPLIASVTSRPVWACSVSGHMSGNLSQHSEDACTAPANAMVPDYWRQWLEIHTYIQNNLSISEADFNSYITANSNHPFQIANILSPINALYNWFLADDAASGALAPTDGSLLGTITPRGEAIGNTLIPEEMRFVAGLLNAAHPGIEFPYSTNQWALQYIVDKSGPVGDADAAALDDLLQTFFNNTPIQPTGLGLIMVGSEGLSYLWAREYLFGKAQNW